MEDIVLGLEPAVEQAWARRVGPGSTLGVVGRSLVREVLLATARASSQAGVDDAAAALGVLRAQEGRQVSAVVEDLLAVRTSMWGLLAGHPQAGSHVAELLLVQQRCTESVDTALRSAVAAFVDESQRVLSRRATRDPLTGLLNRAALDEALAHEVVARTAPPCVLLIDLDGFKQVNDSRGHLVGDEVLVATAELLVRVCRAGDVVGRLGGDEFAVVLPACRPDVAETVAGRLLAAAAKDKGLRPDGCEPVGLSIGLGWREAPVSAEELLEAADEAMYRAKRSGGAALAVDPVAVAS
jgi:diguanylate cyclase (GGDEF)-like protein